MPSADLRSLSALELARGLREKRWSSVELIQLHSERIRQVNPRINAMVRNRFSAALAEARRVDEALAAGQELPAFAGLPCSINECFALTGMPQTAGLVARRGHLACQDAPAVARLRAAGAIPLGVTNVSELCMWMESANKLYGRTRNPYDDSRIVGGSSGGEAAIVAAGGAPFGLGSDVGGSIRMPAFFNGIFGHKPSGGLVPNTGQFPVAQGEWALRILCTGPLCRRAEDLWPLLQILAGPDGQDAGCRPGRLRSPTTVDLQKLRVLDVQGNGRQAVSGELLDAQSRAAGHLESLGARHGSKRFDGLKDSFLIWSAMLSEADPRPYKSLLGQGRAKPALPELGRWLLGRSPHTFPSVGLALLEDLAKLSPGLRRRSLRLGEELKAELSEALDEKTVLLYPSYTRVAPRHNRPIFTPFDWVYTAIWNAMELPVTQVPLGLNAQGLPLGVQVVGAPGADHVCVAVAMELERAFGGWVPPQVRGSGARGLVQEGKAGHDFLWVQADEKI